MGYERHDSRYRDNQELYRPAEQNRYRAEGYGPNHGQAYGRDRDTRRSPAPSQYDYDDRGFFDRAGDEVRSWFGDEEAERRRRWDEREYERRYGGPAAAGRYGDAYGYGGSGYSAGLGGLAAYGGYEFGAPEVFTPYTGGTYLESSRPYHDPHYREWRYRQIAALDREYADYRREHQLKFEQDFGTWRDTRNTQRNSLNNAREHQEVVGSDGKHVGTVDKVRDERIILTKTDKDASGHHHSIPVSWIMKVEEKVELNVTADYAQAVWKDEERRSAIGGRDWDDSNGPHILNRSFSGTY